MPGGYPYLGPAGALVQLPSPAPGYEPAEVLRAGTHELLGGGNVRDRLGIRRRITLAWPALSDDNYSLVRGLVRSLGPFRYLDPTERNLLTPNQAGGSDDLRTIEGVSARTQGTITSSTTFARSGQRSLAWATGSALAATDRGYALRTSSTVDATWTAVRPSIAYTVSAYARTSAAVSMKAGMEWYDAAGTIIGSAVFGSGVPLSTSNFNTRVTHTATSPSNAAYAVGLLLNSTTTGAAITTYADEFQLEEAGSVGTWRLGVGSPLVAVEGFSASVPLADATLGFAWHEVELVLVEL